VLDFYGEQDARSI